MQLHNEVEELIRIKKVRVGVCCCVRKTMCFLSVYFPTVSRQANKGRFKCFGIALTDFMIEIFIISFLIALII